MRRVWKWLASAAMLAAMGAPAADGAETPPALAATQAFLRQHCADCHGEDSPEGDVSLASLGALDAGNADLWQRVLTQLATGEMPPDGQPKPDFDQREATILWITGALQTAGREPHLPGGMDPKDGNLVDHDRLFSGRNYGPASSPPRYWRRSQSQYDALMEQLWVIPKLRYEKAHSRSNPDWAAYSYSQPFPGLDASHFTNYSGGVHADETVLRALMDAGTQIAERLTADKVAYSSALQPPVAVGVPSVRRGSPFEKFLLEPPARPAEFEPFVTGEQAPAADEQAAALRRVFQLILLRAPTEDEAGRYGRLLAKSVEKSGPLAALRGLITAVMVSPEFVFRMEIGRGPTDEHGRRMLSPSELVFAIAYALTDDGPDAALWEAARTGRLQTKADVEREVRRLLADEAIEKHRTLRFFQEFFGYHRAGEVFKDAPGWGQEVQYLVRDADMLVEHALQHDRRVFEELLTTDRYFVAYPHIKDPVLFDAIIEKTLQETREGIDKAKQRGQKIEPARNRGYSRGWAYLQGYDLIPRTVHNDPASFEMSYIHAYNIDGQTFNWTRNQPIEVPGRRAGILTHPAWLVAQSTNSDNYVVGRGHWIREHLLAGNIPDVPLDVDAQVPDEPDSTLRERMRVTREARCIRCHRRMDPLGFPFEIYDHFGHFRTQEMVGANKNQPRDIDPSGEIIASGDPELDGPVADAIELVHKLAGSPRVRQSILRHAFRYWMGRNEMLSDTPTLQAADRAYVASDGSFREVLVLLLTSDSFLYRK